MDKTSILPFCVYTILHTDKLDEIYSNEGKGRFKEGKKWVTAEKMLREAKRNDVKMLVLFAAAEYTDDLIYYAIIDDIRIDSELSATTVKFSRLTPFKSKRPSKESLIIKSTGKPISPGFIRPYAICKTPLGLLKS